ncbi:hypothetical protein AAG570_007288 [Ranatra chinensis]|uniref:Uncharacterized protein n=1 Tax=Ranatra chinensis TaxID=642074 RepID=A0ABD0XWL9_9HEMI
MASKRRNVSYENKKQETTEIGTYQSYRHPPYSYPQNSTIAAMGVAKGVVMMCTNQRLSGTYEHSGIVTGTFYPPIATSQDQQNLGTPPPPPSVYTTSSNSQRSQHQHHQQPYYLQQEAQAASPGLGIRFPSAVSDTDYHAMGPGFDSLRALDTAETVGMLFSSPSQREHTGFPNVPKTLSWDRILLGSFYEEGTTSRGNPRYIRIHYQQRFSSYQDDLVFGTDDIRSGTYTRKFGRLIACYFRWLYYKV